MRTAFPFLLASLVSIAAPLSAQDETDAAKARAANRLLENIRTFSQVPGVSAAVTIDGQACLDRGQRLGRRGDQEPRHARVALSAGQRHQAVYGGARPATMGGRTPRVGCRRPTLCALLAGPRRCCDHTSPSRLAHGRNQPLPEPAERSRRAQALRRYLRSAGLIL